jgi:8-oxo-dGTP pyrophosphatase MutT (NUDIX family)
MLASAVCDVRLRPDSPGRHPISVLVYPEEARYFFTDMGVSVVDLTCLLGIRVLGWRKTEARAAREALLSAQTRPRPERGQSLFPSVHVFDFLCPGETSDRCRIGALALLALCRFPNGGKIEVFAERLSFEGDRDTDAFCWDVLMRLYYTRISANEPWWLAPESAGERSRGVGRRKSASAPFPHLTPMSLPEQIATLPPLVPTSPASRFVRHASVAVLSSGSKGRTKVLVVWDGGVRGWVLPGGAVDRATDAHHVEAAVRELAEELNPAGDPRWDRISRRIAPSVLPDGHLRRELQRSSRRKWNECVVYVPFPDNRNRPTELVVFRRIRRSFGVWMKSEQKRRGGFVDIPTPSAYAHRDSTSRELRDVHRGILKYVEHLHCALLSMDDPSAFVPGSSARRLCELWCAESNQTKSS